MILSESIKQKYYTFQAKGEFDAELLLYGEIGESFFGDGITVKQFAEDLKKVKSAKVLAVRIDSPGGSVRDGLGIYNQLARFPGVVEVDIDGAAWSIASVIAMSGKRIRMAKNATLMIHDPAGLVAGSANDMRQMANILDLIKESIVGVYTDRTGLPEEQVINMMTEETWLTPEQAHAQGFVHEITPNVMATNEYDTAKFKHPPQIISGLPINLRTRLAHMDQRARNLRVR